MTYCSADPCKSIHMYTHTHAPHIEHWGPHTVLQVCKGSASCQRVLLHAEIHTHNVTVTRLEVSCVYKYSHNVTVTRPGLSCVYTYSHNVTVTRLGCPVCIHTVIMSLLQDWGCPVCINTVIMSLLQD